ncbi:MAG: hypothetical protein Q7R57_07780 [Dehalococcoidales bacterium]|nr:hypothetical protein [Dehalococcoidales bacterium]
MPKTCGSKAKRHRALAIVVMLLLLWAGSSRAAAQEPDWDIENGHFYTQAGPGDGTGYAVTDSDGVPFWSRFRQLGGVDAVGFPVSQRFIMDGFVTQAMQRLVFQWEPDTGEVRFLNAMDILSQMGSDAWLLSSYQAPGPAALDEAGKSWDEIVSTRLSLLDDRAAIKAKFFSVQGDPIAFNGLPASRATDMGSHYALRTQRVVLQEWKEDVPWARQGQVTVALGGSIAREAGLVPEASSHPQSGPPPVKSASAHGQNSLFATRQVVSLYGFPGVPVLGALGEQELGDTVTRVQDMAGRVDAINGPLATQPALHVIYAIAQRSRVPAHLDSATTDAYIAAAEGNGLLVFLDLQIAGSPLPSEIARVLPYLHHANVHIAIDPEFVTDTPGDVIGSLDAGQINAAQQQVTDYLEQQGIGGQKILIVHQFDDSMITNKRLLKDYPRIDLVIDADGVGSKGAKTGDYNEYAADPTREYLGFKVFLKHDTPPMTIQEVLALDPPPNMMIFQ